MILPLWLANLIGGKWRSITGGIGWTPGVWRLTWKYYRSGLWRIRSWSECCWERDRVAKWVLR